MMAWRSNPLVYQGFYTQRKPLTWEEHLAWWQSRNKDWRIFIIILNDEHCYRRLGVVNIGQLDYWSPEIGYYIGEVSLWGNGYGKEAVELAIDWLRSKGYKYTHTTVLKSNKRSLRLLFSLGFKKFGDARDGELWLTKKL